MTSKQMLGEELLSKLKEESRRFNIPRNAMLKIILTNYFAEKEREQ